MISFVDVLFLRLYSIGFVQFIDSQPLRCVLERHRTIRQYLQSKVNQETNLNDLGIPHDVLDAYVKSCGNVQLALRPPPRRLRSPFLFVQLATVS